MKNLVILTAVTLLLPLTAAASKPGPDSSVAISQRGQSHSDATAVVQEGLIDNINAAQDSITINGVRYFMDSHKVLVRALKSREPVGPGQLQAGQAVSFVVDSKSPYSHWVTSVFIMR